MNWTEIFSKNEKKKFPPQATNELVKQNTEIKK